LKHSEVFIQTDDGLANILMQNPQSFVSQAIRNIHQRYATID